MLLDIKKEIKDTSVNLKKSIDQKFENLSDSLYDKMTKEFSEMKDHVDLEVGKLQRKIELLEVRVGSIEERDYVNRSNPFETEHTVVAINLKEEPGENIEEVVADLFNEGLGIRDIEPVQLLRLKGRDGKPGIVKIELPRKEDKIHVLRAKTKLKDSNEFKRVYLRSSMTHAERLIQYNFREILNELPNGSNYRIAGNGRIIKKTNEDESRDVNVNQRTSSYSNGRGRGSLRGRGRGRQPST
jgi:hypothetical protein